MLFVYRGREYRVVRAEGPERLETGWWRGPDIRRDYYRVVTDTGEQFWLFRVLDRRVGGSHSTGHGPVSTGPMSNGLGEPCWFVHGIFG